MSDFAYDIIEYTSYPYSQSHPEHLYTIAKLFKLNPEHYRQAKILELGCGSGGNIIPIAFNLSETEILGIDLSGAQIDLGNKIINDLELTNIKLEKRSIGEIIQDDGKFDYIICHGVYSWVSDEIQKSIFNVCKNNLEENGIAYISYNTLPGWNSVKTFRDMMRYHVENFETPGEKSKQARLLLDFVNRGLKESSSPYAQLLKEEIDLLAERSDSYLIHDHLADLNEPVYFHQFIEEASKYGLFYLADTPVSNMYAFNLPSEIAQKLIDIPDIIRTVQYMDFIRNQRFKCTLLCHKAIGEKHIDRDLKLKDIKKFYISYTPALKNMEQLKTDKINITYEYENISIKLHDEISRKAFEVLFKYKTKPISFDKLCDDLSEILEENKNDISDHLINNLNLMRLMLAGIISIHSDDGDYVLEISEKPMVNKYVQYKSQNDSFVTNLRHESLAVSFFERALIQFLDGQHTIEEIISELTGQIISGELELYNKEGEKIVNDKEVKVQIKTYITDSLKKFAEHALLIA